MLEIASIDLREASEIFEKVHHKYAPPLFGFAIRVIDGAITKGVIVIDTTPPQCGLGHLWTSGEPLVGSILYGAAWRAAKALGYKQITL